MNMIVGIKQVLDPEAPPASSKIDAASNKAVQPPNVSLVVTLKCSSYSNPFAKVDVKL